MQMRMIIGPIIISLYTSMAILLALAPSGARAGSADHRVYTDPETFLSNAFQHTTVPAVKALWPNQTLREELTKILGHKPSLRFKYWGADDQTVWVLDEIGKEHPITAGVVVKNGRIASIDVLVFRESRGWEVKYEF